VLSKETRQNTGKERRSKAFGSRAGLRPKGAGPKETRKSREAATTARKVGEEPRKIRRFLELG